MKLDSRNDLSAYNFVSPSWCQIDNGEIFKNAEDSVWKNM